MSARVWADRLDLAAATVTVSGTKTALRLDRRYGHVRLNANTSATIEGLAGVAPGRIVRLTSIGAGAVTLAHDASGAASFERLDLPGDADVELAEGESVCLVYDDQAGGGDGRWRLLERAPGIVYSQGSSFPSSPADYQQHFHTARLQTYVHDPTLGKWIGPPTRLGFGHVGGQTGNFFLDGPGEPVHGGTDRGHFLGDVDYRLLELHGSWANSVSGNIRLRRSNSNIASVALSGAGNVVDRNLATTFTAGGVLQIYVQLTLGTMTNATMGVVVAPLENVT